MSLMLFKSPDGVYLQAKSGNLCDLIYPENTENACNGCPLHDVGCAPKCSQFAQKAPNEFKRLTGFSYLGIDKNAARQQEPLGPTGFVRDSHAGKGRMDLLPWIGIMEVSKLCEEGAEHYGERNIDKGAPLHSLLDSGARHLAKVMSGCTDEDHLRAACWNLLWALQERTTHPELNDTPWPWFGKEAQT